MVIRKYNYKDLAEYYDVLELDSENTLKMNNFLGDIFRSYNVKSALDMTCGTGAQTIELKKKGYDIAALDISKEMLNVARKKSKDLAIKFYQGDIRTSKIGKFDAVIAIFNAIGHLSKKDFGIAISNISDNLKNSGLFIFDIFNLDFMKSGGFIKHRFIDKAKEHSGIKYVRFNKNTIDYKNGIMGVNQEVYIQEGLGKPKIIKEKWDMQIYSSKELTEILKKYGFKVLKFYGGPEDVFIKDKSLSIYVVAKKS